MLGLLFARACTLTSAIPKEVCEECEDIATPGASAMLQVEAKPAKAGPLSFAAEASASAPGAPASDSQQSRRCTSVVAEDTHLEESRQCLPSFLQGAHLSAIRLHAARLVGKSSSKPKKKKDLVSKKDLLEAEDSQELTSSESSKKFPPSVENGGASDPPTEAPVEEEEEEEQTTSVTGATASLDAAGFRAVTSLCCPPEMEAFFDRLLNSMGLEVCSKPHVQGLMHWFSCVPDMDFQYMLDVIQNGNPCKYWTSTGTTCPAISDTCAGKFCR